MDRRVRGIKRDPDEFSVLRSHLVAVGFAVLGQSGRICRGVVRRPQLSETPSGGGRCDVDVTADFGNLQFLAAGSFTSALWESSETSVGVSLRRRLEPTLSAGG